MDDDDDDEIGCMCEKCSCLETVPTVTSICDSCLHENHIHKNNMKSEEKFYEQEKC